MITILLFLVVLIVFDSAAMRWGFNSTEAFESPQWQQRQYPPLA
jgi:hypothetical protein